MPQSDVPTPQAEELMAYTVLVAQLTSLAGSIADNLPDMLDGSFTMDQVEEEFTLLAALRTVLDKPELLQPHV